MQQFTSGNTFSIFFDFFDNAFQGTSVENIVVEVFTPERQRHLSSTSIIADPEIEGKYRYDFFVTPGLTVGSWYAFASGITQNSTTFANVQPFDIIDHKGEANWLGVGDVRDWLEEDPSDHSNDKLFQRVLTASMHLIEEKTGRPWGQCPYSETFQIKCSARRMLQKYPVIRITGMTATAWGYTPREPATPNTETNAGETTPFYFRLKENVGAMIFTDSDGLECTYSDCIVTLDYTFGTATIPEPIRLATLMLTSKLLNIAQQEGIDNLRIADANFSIDRKLFSGEVGDLIAPYSYSTFGGMWVSE